ncbi:MAG TPA: CPBP family intramembrane metalloprotease [Clostridiaceae bacterium]|nr:CPBP family intramembrane metalloprotease [Clostridiaceae bacterium]
MTRKKLLKTKNHCGLAQMTGVEIIPETEQPAVIQNADRWPQQPCDPDYVQRQPSQQPCDPDYVQERPSQQPCDPDYVQERPSQQPCDPDYTQGQSPQNLPIRIRQQIRPNGKYYFSARTIVYPIVFLVVHFLTQLLAGVLASVLALKSYMASDSFSSFIDDDLTLDMLQHFFKDVGIRALLYSTPLQIIICVIFICYQKRKNRQYLLVRPFHATAFPLGFATAFGCLGVATLLIQLFDMLAKYNSFWQNMMVNYQQSTEALQGVDLLLTTLGVAVLVPIAEELLFRGIITEEIRRVAPDWLAILLGGVIFALVHGNIVQILYVLPLGLLLGAAYIWSNSIWVPILMHVIFNFFGSILGMQIGENETVLTVYTVFLFVMIPVGVVSAFIMNRMYRKNKRVVLEKVCENSDYANVI